MTQPLSLTLLSAALVVFTQGPCPAAAPAPGEAARAPVALPGGGVAEPDGKVGYVPNPSGGIDALNLADGTRLWDTREAPRPLLATADRLFVQAPVRGKANQVRILVLDATQKGKRLLESQPVTFADWVSVGVTYGRSFALAARLDGEGGLLLTWTARSWYAGGARPTPEIERRARRAASGVAHVDLKTGRVEALEGDKVPKGTPRTVPGEVRSAKVGGRVYSIEDKPGGVPGRPFQRKRTLRAADDNGKVLWERAIAGPVFLQPLP